MPTINQLPSGKWRAQIRLKGLRPQSKSFPTYEQAEYWAALLEDQMRSSLSPSNPTILLAGNSYLSTLKPSTAKVYMSRLRNIHNFFKELPLDCITTKLLVGYTNYRSSVSSSTARGELQLLDRIMKHSRKMYGVYPDTNPFTDFTLPKEGQPRDRVLTDIEYNQILADISPKVMPYLVLAWETSCRRSELLAVRAGWVHLEERVILLPAEVTKNGKTRAVPLSKKAVRLLTRLTRGINADEQLFNLQPSTVSRAFKRCCERLGIEGACLHSIRHTAITRYAKLLKPIAQAL